MNNLILKFGKILLTSLTFVSLIYLQKKNLDKIYQPKHIDYIEQEKLLASQIKLEQKIPELGFSNLLANWDFLQFIQYFGDNEARKVTGHSLISEYFSSISERDPYFVNAYLMLSSANSIYAAQPEKTVKYLNEILQVIPPEKFTNASFIWSYKATDEILFLGDLKAAEHSYRMAADWAKKRGDETGELIAQRNLDTANFLASNPDSTSVQITAWVTVLNQALDDKTRNYALNKLRELGWEVSLTPEGKLQLVPTNNKR
jgi:hypothetical protein